MTIKYEAIARHLQERGAEMQWYQERAAARLCQVNSISNKLARAREQYLTSAPDFMLALKYEIDAVRMARELDVLLPISPHLRSKLQEASDRLRTRVDKQEGLKRLSELLINGELSPEPSTLYNSNSVFKFNVPEEQPEEDNK